MCLKKFPGAHNTVHWDIDSYIVSATRSLIVSATRSLIVSAARSLIVSAARSLTCRDDLDSKWRLLLAENELSRVSLLS